MSNFYTYTVCQFLLWEPLINTFVDKTLIERWHFSFKDCNRKWFSRAKCRGENWVFSLISLISHPKLKLFSMFFQWYATLSLSLSCIFPENLSSKSFFSTSSQWNEKCLHHISISTTILFLFQPSWMIFIRTTLDSNIFNYAFCIIIVS